jgi:hypothetical protein
MGYPSPLTVIHRQMNASSLLSSVSFTHINKFKFGNRMALIKVLASNNVVVWNAIPVNTGVFTKAITKLGDVNVVAVIIPDIQHTLATLELKKKYPDIFLIGPSGITEEP